MRPQHSPCPPPPPSSSHPATSFPILAISIFGIVTTSILLLSYYVFVIKCCVIWRRSDALGRFARSSRRLYRLNSRPPGTYEYSTDDVAQPCGLEESAIQAIPSLKYRKISERGGAAPSAAAFHECAVCLNEFQEEERIRMLPSCFHVFHIDCIDTWLQTHASCPLCRSSIGSSIPVQAYALMAALVPHQDPHRSELVIDIEVSEEDQSEDLGDNNATTDPSPGAESEPRTRKLSHINSMGDELVQAIRRSKLEQPMRRSLSMDSSGDAQLYMAVQEILQQNPHFRYAPAAIDGQSGSSTSSGGLRQSFFSFGRSSRSASVLPVQFEP